MSEPIQSWLIPFHLLSSGLVLSFSLINSSSSGWVFFPLKMGGSDAVQKLSPTENTMLGIAAGIIEVTILQPMLYCKNATQQKLPFTLNPRILYRGISEQHVWKMPTIFRFGHEHYKHGHPHWTSISLDWRSDKVPCPLNQSTVAPLLPMLATSLLCRIMHRSQRSRTSERSPASIVGIQNFFFVFACNWVPSAMSPSPISADCGLRIFDIWLI